MSHLTLAQGKALPYDPEAQEKAVEEGGETTITQPEGFKFPELDTDTKIIIKFLVFIIGTILIIGLIKRKGRTSAEFMMKKKF